MTELEKNMKAYKMYEHYLLRNYRFSYALFSDGALVGVHKTNYEAYIAGLREYGISNFSIKRITDKPINVFNNNEIKYDFI